jgi:hypothetical protein
MPRGQALKSTRRFLKWCIMTPNGLDTAFRQPSRRANSHAYVSGIQRSRPGSLGAISATALGMEAPRSARSYRASTGLSAVAWSTILRAISLKSSFLRERLAMV